MGQADAMEIVLVHLAAEDDAHEMEALADRRARIEEQPAQNLEVRHADHRLGAGLEDPLKLPQRARQRVAVPEVLEHVRRVELVHRSVGELAEIGAVADKVDRRPGLDVEDLPALLRLRAADMQAQRNVRAGSREPARPGRQVGRLDRAREARAVEQGRSAHALAQSLPQAA